MLLWSRQKSIFPRSFNAIFSKMGRFTSEEVVIGLIHAKCLVALLYGTEACHILAWDKRSVEFAVTRSLMKLFRTSSAIIVEDCQKRFHLLPVSYLTDISMAEFLKNFVTHKNWTCKLFARNAQCSLDKMFYHMGMIKSLLVIWEVLLLTCFLSNVINDIIMLIFT